MASAIELPDAEELERFRELVLEEGRAHWRDLPWRNIDDPYAVLVSEVMLQQTQVKRVLNYWGRFLAVFPTLDALASAETSLVLEMWQGLGYNRRALALKRCAVECSEKLGGSLPETIEELVQLPGIGPATAAGVTAFARNRRCMYLETNVRSVFIHHFFPGASKVPDSQVSPLVQAACPQQDVRGWYYALLDYGAHLKATIPNPSRRSAGYTRQSAFEGSRRQKRAQVMRFVLGKPGIGDDELHGLLDDAEMAAGRPVVRDEEFRDVVDSLVAEGFFAYAGGGYRP